MHIEVTTLSSLKKKKILKILFQNDMVQRVSLLKCSLGRGIAVEALGHPFSTRVLRNPGVLQEVVRGSLSFMSHFIVPAEFWGQCHLARDVKFPEIVKPWENKNFRKIEK